MPKAKGQTILITAGEASGDRLGGALMHAIKAQNPSIRFIGVGGAEMEAAGLAPIFPMSDLAVMGLVEVLPSIPRILSRLRQLQALAESEKPDVIITIDSQDFSSRLAKRLKPLGIPHIHYVAPKVWAWRQHRVRKLKDLYTHLLTILPFEEEFFGTAGIPTTYVGHPATTALAPFTHVPHAKAPTLALLPGSRTAELTRHWPLFLQTYRSLKADFPMLQAVLALPHEHALNLCQKLAPWKKSDAITTVYGDDRFPALAATTAALSKSGTNNLEIALLNVPAAVVYVMNDITFTIAKRVVRVPVVSLPNLILHFAKKPVVYPELIQDEATRENLTAALSPLIGNGVEAATQRASLKALHELMATPKPPAEQAAQIVLKYL